MKNNRKFNTESLCGEVRWATKSKLVTVPVNFPHKKIATHSKVGLLNMLLS